VLPELMQTGPKKKKKKKKKKKRRNMERKFRILLFGSLSSNVYYRAVPCVCRVFTNV
jgi:hypothetical protein